MLFDPNIPKAECVRLAHVDKLGKDVYMTSRWDAHGAFISGAAFQHRQMNKEIETLRMLVADVYHGFLSEAPNDTFDWDAWIAIAQSII